jgi:hypothetical protein
MVQQFMADLTRSMLGDRIVLTCLDAELQSSGGIAASRVEEARRVFGPEDEQRGSYRTHPNWTLTEAQLPSAIEFALDDDKFSKQDVGPSWLSFSYQFCWLAFDRGSAAEGNAEARRILSVLGVTIGRQRLFLQPYFIYPAAWNSEVLKDFIDRSESVVPFRFRDRYFKRWLPLKRPANYGRLLRLEPTWRRGTVLH